MKTFLLTVTMLLLIATGFVLSNSSYKEMTEDELLLDIAERYPALFTIDEDSVELKKVEDKDLKALFINPALLNIFAEENPISEDLKIIDVVLDQIINIGKKIWNIVKKGEPVINIKTDWASAMPKGVKHWTQLHSWNTPKAINYQMTYKNGYGIKVVDLIYRVIFTYGGAVDGKGKFIANAKVIPLKANVLWGYKVNVDVQIAEVLNVGTKEDPVGALELLVSTKVNTVIKSSELGHTFYMTGRGEFKDFNH